MGKIIDLIKNFIEPKKQQTFEELAIDSGVNQNQLKQLKSTMEGISWSTFAREDDDRATRKRGKSAINQQEVNINLQENTSIRRTRNKGIERE